MSTFAEADGRVDDSYVRTRIREDLTTNFIVGAGAGSGKTSVLVSRVVNLLVDRGVPPEKVAAITFTDAAAGELRARIRRELAAIAESGEGKAEGGPGNAGRTRRAADALRRLDEATIGTIHSFCLQILREHGHAIGLPPAVEILDDYEDARRTDARISRIVDALASGAAASQLWIRLLAFGVKISSIRELVRKLDDDWDRLDGLADLPDWTPPDLREARDCLRRAVALADECSDEEDPLYVRLQEMVRPLLVRLDEVVGDEVETIRLLAHPPLLKALVGKSMGRKDNWSGGSLALVREELSRARDRVERERARIGDSLVRELVARVARFVVAEAWTRVRAGTLRFHDLLVLARHLLRSHPEVRRQLADRYRHILIDEFQDTDPLQLEIAVMLAAEEAEGVGLEVRGDLLRVTLRSGALFLVGDRHQAIYRFRRADVELYESARSALALESVHLRSNFRSRPVIVEWVETVFGELFAPIVDDEADAPGDDSPPPDAVAPRPRNIAAVRDPGLGGPDVVVFGAAHDDMASVREAEAHDVARMVAVDLRRGWEVRDQESGEVRPARMADVAVLVPTRAWLPALEKAFSRFEVPFSVDATDLLFETRVSRQLLATLQAIADPCDEVAVVAALRGPVAWCSDVDLLRWRRSGGGWNPLDLADGEGGQADGPVREGLLLLADLHRLAGTTTVASLVDELVGRTRWRHQLLLDRRPSEARRQFDFVVSEVLSAGEGRSLREALDVLGTRRDSPRNLRAGVPAGDDAVRVLTIHAAKGLEFPIVFVCGASAPRRASGEVVVHWPRDPGRPPAVRLQRDVQTLDFPERSESEKQESEYERVRLYYVACTRARDHLLVSVHRKSPAKGRPDESLAARIADASRRAGIPAVESTGSPATPYRPEEVTGSPTVPQLQPDPADGAGGAAEETFDLLRRRWQAEREALLKSSAPKPTVSVDRLWVCSVAGACEERGTLSAPSTSGIRGSEEILLDRAVHEVIERIELPGSPADIDDDRLERIARVRAAVLGIPHLGSRVAGLVRSALSSSIDLGITRRRHERAVRVTSTWGEVILDGVVDLLFEEDGGVSLLDWDSFRHRKRDCAGSSTLDDDATGPRLRLGVLAFLTERATGSPVRRCLHVGLSEEGASITELGDPRGVIEEANEQLRRIFARRV
ncbi:MAG: ATP-dependent DNA helicase [Acidimicrobiales bacterium]|nr:MAG: ATP-dependent DNA helicase [Acidimicrobiales bacterium]